MAGAPATTAGGGGNVLVDADVDEVLDMAAAAQRSAQLDAAQRVLKKESERKLDEAMRKVESIT